MAGRCMKCGDADRDMRNIAQRSSDSIGPTKSEVARWGELKLMFSSFRLYLFSNSLVLLDLNPPMVNPS